jgi:hypothetical protein
MNALPMDTDRALVRALTAVVAIVAIAMTFIKGNVLLADPDTQWHIATGRLIWETGQMPRVDTMSHTYAGQPWIAKEWLSQVVLFAAYSAGGWVAVMLLGGSCLALTAAILANRVLKSAPPILAICICWFALSSLLMIATPRPHLLALPVMALFAKMLLDASEGDQSPPWLALPLMTLWANLHAAFTLGLVMAGFMALDAFLRAAPERRMRLMWLWGAFGLGLLGAACIHPYGVQSLLINIDMARGNESVPFIGEWDPHPILSLSGINLLLPMFFVATLVIGGVRNAARIGLGLFMAYLTWKHQRFIMMLAVVAPMITCHTVGRLFVGLAERLKVFQRQDPLRDPKWRVPMMLTCAAIALALPFAAERSALPAISAPQDALNSVPPEIRATPVYNSYRFGGFLVLNRVPTFIDGRTDQLFVDNFIGRIFNYMKDDDATRFMAFIEARGVRWAIVHKEFPETRFLEQAPGWRETFSDGHSKVFVRDGG